MKRLAISAAVLMIFMLTACQAPLGELDVKRSDPIGGLTVRIRTSAAHSLSRAITGVTKMVVNLESSEYPSIYASADAEPDGSFVASIDSMKPGQWTVKVSLFDSSNVERYFGQAVTVIQAGVANSVDLAVRATGSLGVDVVEDTTGPRVATPVISPGVTNRYEVFYVSISCDSPGAIIRFTLDGSEPTVSNGFLYAEPFMICEDVTIRAVALKDGLAASAISEISYDLALPTYSVGSPGPAGGQVLYDAGDYSMGWRYLEAAPADLVVGEVDWWTALDLCADLRIGGYAGWRLPSYMEAKKIHFDLFLSGGINLATARRYWTSTTVSTASGYSSFDDASAYAYQPSMSSFQMSPMIKSGSYWVRPVRSF